MNLFRTIRNRLRSRGWRERRRARWNDKWAEESFSPPWLERDIPSELLEFSETTALGEAMTVLDVGCGQGAIAGWFAEKGCTAVGVDLAESAIRTARQRHEDGKKRLRYLAVDFCHESRQLEGEFQVVVDRGCFHGIPEHDRKSYARALARVAQEGSDYFLFIRAFRDPRSQDRTAERNAKRAEIEAFFGRYFVLQDSHDTSLGTSDGATAGEALPGLFFHMKRKRKVRGSGSREPLGR